MLINRLSVPQCSAAAPPTKGLLSVLGFPGRHIVILLTGRNCLSSICTTASPVHYTILSLQCTILYYYTLR